MAVLKFLKAAIFWKIIWCRLRLQPGYALQYYFYLAGFADGRLLGGLSVLADYAAVAMSGGILGVIFTVPLRYAMVVKSDLPYPEGVAAAEILKVGDLMRTNRKAAAVSRNWCRAALWPV